MKDLTLFHLDSERGLRGGEKQLLYLASGLARLGHKNTVVCRKNSLLAREAKRFGLETIELPLWGEWDLISAWRLRQILKKQPQAIVHSHSAHAAMTAFWATRGLPVYRVAHRRINFPVSNRLSYFLKYETAHRVLTVSQDLYNQMLQDSKKSANIRFVPSAVYTGNLRLLYDGIELAPFAIAKNKEELKKILGLDSKEKIIISVGALTEQKDHSTLLKAITCLKNLSPKSPFKLLIAGDGPLLNNLLQEARNLDVDNIVQFLGFRQDVPNLLGASDIFVLSSTHEGFCNALLEAMAAGLPIVATKAGGNEEIVNDQKTGLLVAPRDPEALAKALRLFINNSDLALNCGQAGRIKVQQFSVKNMVENIEKIYSDLIKEAK